MSQQPISRSRTQVSSSNVPSGLDRPGAQVDSITPTNDFVMEPPKPKVGLTGKISTLFRQSKSHSEHEIGGENSSTAGTVTNYEVMDDRHTGRPMRNFYNSNEDHHSENSYISEDDEDNHSSDMSQSTTTETTPILRFRGFSTSIRSLFLDEPLVCASIACFGLFLSSRTEYLLELRNERRGWGKANKTRQPSRIMAYGLLVATLLMFSTFLIFGFGSGNGLAGDYVSGYDYYSSKFDRSYGKDDDVVNANAEGDDTQEQWWDDYLQNTNNKRYYNNAQNTDDDGNYANNKDGGKRRLIPRSVYQDEAPKRNAFLPINGIFKIRDCHEQIWQPIADFVRDEYEIYDQLQANNYRSGQQRRRAEANGNTDDDAFNNDDANDMSYNDYGKSSNGTSDASSSRDPVLGSQIRTGIFVSFLIFLALLGRRRRMRTRFYVVRARAQEDHLYYASSDEAATRRVALDGALEDQYEGACSHTFFGCYPVDDMVDGSFNEHIEVSDEGIFRRKKRPHHEDSVARGFNCLMSMCCGVVCKCWLQCLSICALAQEAREMRLLLPPRYQRVDFITHQPFHEYQKQINDLRKGWKGYAKSLPGIIPHFRALSRLSRYILLGFLLSSCAIVATVVLNPLTAFSWQDALLLGATFAQSLIILVVVHWIFHKSDLSLDAVIKCVAAGFLVAVPAAVVLEGLLVNVFLFGAWLIYLSGAVIQGDDFTDWVDDHGRLIWIISELLNAFIVASLVEELCKYYTFRAIEHPDLVFLTGLQRQEEDSGAIDGGLVKYPFASHRVQEFIKNNVDKSRTTSFLNEDTLLRTTGTTDTEFDEDETDIRTHRQRAMAITTAMISVAVGLACAENCLYVFVLGGTSGQNSNNENFYNGDVMEAWILLFFRSIFPIHALAAAMQSINMIRKFVEHDHENGHRIGAGRIVLPAVILHGTFDAILMGINVFIETAWESYDENGAGSKPYNKFILNLVAWISISLILILGIMWYLYQNRQQRSRLIRMEETERAHKSRHGKLEPWKYPAADGRASVANSVYA